jgi:hypothetical protein
MSKIPSEDIYVIKRYAAEKREPDGSVEDVTLFGTYTDLAAAKKASYTVLQFEGYEKEFFATYDINDATKEWTHGDGVMVYAVTPTGEKFRVEIETEPNTTGLIGDVRGKVGEVLYHILQTTINYNIDASGNARTTTVEGTFKSEVEAKKAAETVLLDGAVKKEDFAEYDVYHGQDEWGYGEEIIVHAVGVGGENILIGVVKN